MTTVVRRTFGSTPHRDAGETWRAIVDLLTQGKTGAKRDELLAVHGVPLRRLAWSGGGSAPTS